MVILRVVGRIRPTIIIRILLVVVTIASIIIYYRRVKSDNNIYYAVTSGRIISPGYAIITRRFVITIIRINSDWNGRNNNGSRRRGHDNGDDNGEPEDANGGIRVMVVVRQKRMTTMMTIVYIS